MKRCKAMITKFIEELGGKLGEKWMATVLTPAFVFFAGGLGAWVWHSGLATSLAWITRQSQITQVVLAVGGLLIVIASGLIVRQFDFLVIRFLEGYWPRWIWPLRLIRNLLLSWQNFWLSRADHRLSALEAKGFESLNAAEREEYASLDWQMMHAPASTGQRMPTRLGNILRAAELRPADKYGLDTLICWPRLWMILPENVRKDLIDARDTLDTGAQVFLWSLLFLIWTVWTWWALVSLLTTFLAYRWILNGAEIYGSLLEAAFDLYRTSLYKSLRWPLPKNPAEEKILGKQLTAYLWRGSDKMFPSFVVLENDSSIKREPEQSVSQN